MAASSGTAVSLQGWDTVNAVTYSTINALIVNTESYPKNFDFEDDTGIKLEGTWTVWRLTRHGDGQNLRIACHIGTGKIIRAEEELVLNGGHVNIEVKLKFLDGPRDKIADPTGTGGDSKRLAVNQDEPVVVLDTGHDSNGPWKNDLHGTFQSYFEKNLVEFKHVFNDVIVNVSANNDNFQWVKPTNVGYAVADTDNLDTSVFAVLGMTGGKSLDNIAHEVDPRILDNLPAGTNSVFAVGGDLLLEKLLLPAAVKYLQGSTAADFTVGEEGLAVVNNKELSWQKIKLQDQSEVTPKVAANNFRISIESDYLQVEFRGMSFNAPNYHFPGNLVVTMDYTRKFYLKATTNSDGGVFITPSDHDPTDATATPGPNITNFNVSVEPDEGAKIFEGCMIGFSVALEVIGIASLGGAGVKAALSRAAQAAVDGAEGGVQMANVVQSVGGNVYEDVGAVLGAVDDAAQGGAAPSRVMFGLGIAGVTSVVLGVPFIGVAIADAVKKSAIRDAMLGEFSSGEKIPTLSDFVNNCLGPSQWPGSTGWTLKDVRLAGSLLLYGDLQQADPPSGT